jgi:SAM-dependent methyltransferase
MPEGAGAVVELGSGAGFIERVIPGVVTTDVLPVRGIRVAADARRLPFVTGSLRGIVMTNVFHHIPDPMMFLKETVRTLAPGGVVAMIEPWPTAWSRFVYHYLHHEPFDEGARDWSLPEGGPLSSANGALPWIVLSRDRVRFELECPAMEIVHLRAMMPIRYLLSGGVSLRSLMPGGTTSLWRGVERALDGWRDTLGMFVLAVMRKRAEPHSS